MDKIYQKQQELFPYLPAYLLNFLRTVNLFIQYKINQY